MVGTSDWTWRCRLHSEAPNHPWPRPRDPSNSRHRGRAVLALPATPIVLRETKNLRANFGLASSSVSCQEGYRSAHATARSSASGSRARGFSVACSCPRFRCGAFSCGAWLMDNKPRVLVRMGSRSSAAPMPPSSIVGSMPGVGRPNGSMELPGRPTSVPRSWSCPGRPAAHFKRYADRVTRRRRRFGK